MPHHTKDKGDLAVALIIADLTIKGYICYTAVISEHMPFDLIVFKDGKLFKLQIKYVSNGFVRNKTVWSSKSKSHFKSYALTDFDYYAIYLSDINKIIYPSIKFGGKTIRSTLPNAANPFYWWEDFIEFTDDAEKHHYTEFDITLTKSKTEACADVFFKARKVIRPSKEELKKMLWEKPSSLLAKDLGVSDKAIEKWAKSYQISKPPRGYWTKLRSTTK